VAALALSCSGTTGYQLVSFYAGARGATDAVKGQPYSFSVGAAQVTLTQATLHVGALYLTQAVPTSGGGPAACSLPGTYDGVFVGEVRGGGDIDLLDPAVQPLTVTGDGSTIPATTGQVWLMHDDVNAESDPLPILTLQGSFVENSVTRTFSGAITIDSSREPSATNSALPGENPICQLRIVAGIGVRLTLAQSGTLVLGVDPKALFANANLAALPQPAGCPTDLCFTNDSSNQPSINLFQNLTSSGDVYGFSWLPAGR
jgi:hypothetical protein